MRSVKLIILILATFLSACSYQKYVHVQLNYTPKSFFRPDSTTVLLVNKFDPDTLKIVNIKKLAVIKAGAFTSAKYAEKLLSQLPNIKIINLVDSADFHANTDSIKQLALKYNANYVLSLHNFNTDIILSDIQRPSFYYNTITVIGFNLYENNGLCVKELNGLANDFQSEMGLGLMAAMVAHPSVKDNKASIITSAQHATQDALKSYTSYSISRKRPLYINSRLQPATEEIFAGNFKKADTLLQPFLKSNRKRIASLAAYNMAVIYESEGKIDSAIYMAHQSLYKFRGLHAAEILNDLNKE
jgi:hypothetical protein